jgi:leader peptidase (prepilin peptidase)/N-methyltransferase
VIPAWIVTAIVFVYGLAMGSFLNVVIHRLPREMSLWRPRSHCPGCGALVAWYDNVPVLGYLWLLGRCRHCRTAISWRYPLVELATAGLLAVTHHRFGLTVLAAEVGTLMLLVVALGFIDLEHHLLPDVLTLPGLALGLGGAALEGWPMLRDGLVGAALGALIPTAVILGYTWLRGREGMGWGDVKLLAMLGAFLGWRGMLMTLVLGSLAGGVVGVGLIVSGRGKSDTELPFGTFLCAAAVPVAFWAPELARVMGWIGP